MFVPLELCFIKTIRNNLLTLPNVPSDATRCSQQALASLSGSSSKRLRDLEVCLEGAATKDELALKADARHAEVGVVLVLYCVLFAHLGGPKETKKMFVVSRATGAAV